MPNRQDARRWSARLTRSIELRDCTEIDTCPRGGSTTWSISSTGSRPRPLWRQGRLADHLTRMDFIILDELGYLPFA
jgi:hypothetical protein